MKLKEIEKVQETKPNYKIVAVRHLNNDYSLKNKDYYFITKDNVNKNDLVYCQTHYGLTIGIVTKILTTIDKLLEYKEEIPQLGLLNECFISINLGTLKGC